MTATLLVTGAGGVGKTTIAAALGVVASRRGLRTLVVTVDPAQRLATALGVSGLSDQPQPHMSEPSLWAAMLDASASWRAVAERHADPDVAEPFGRERVLRGGVGALPGFPVIRRSRSSGNLCSGSSMGPGDRRHSPHPAEASISLPLHHRWPT